MALVTTFSTSSCATRRHVTGWDGRPTSGLSQQPGEAGGSLIREVPGRVGAAPTTPGRVSTARWCGLGKCDEEEYARNQRDYVPRKVNRLKSGG